MHDAENLVPSYGAEAGQPKRWIQPSLSPSDADYCSVILVACITLGFIGWDVILVDEEPVM